MTSGLLKIIYLQILLRRHKFEKILLKTVTNLVSMTTKNHRAKRIDSVDWINLTLHVESGGQGKQDKALIRDDFG